MRASTASASLAVPICRLGHFPDLRQRVSPCFSFKTGIRGVASTGKRSPSVVEAVSPRRETDLSKGESMRSAQAGQSNLMFSTCSLGLILTQLLPSETVAAFAAEESNPSSHMLKSLVLMDLDPGTAKLAISIVGPLLSAYGFLFIARIVMSWYPKLPVDKFPYVVAYAPTEPVLILTRKVIPPLGGVDVTPVVWFGLISFLNEILVGPQGLLVLLSQQV